MYLKTLTLRGFKSFASATTMRLQPGITCVVGPNGSGKSNVVDALAWVMGEQGARTLRGGAMADVIFAGTTGRAPLGRAQVDLTIDNSDGTLDIDYSEVTISRTLFRGGGSEYSINGTPARLLDIQDLLSDTGMGRQMHVIVGQGQLDAILSSTPQERRGFIEEAAGVLKHRRRKERALKKLGDMDANLARVIDITDEIRRQLGPLARQAKAARRASLLQARLRDARARLLASDLAEARARLAQLSESDEAAKQRRTQLEKELAQARSALSALEDTERASAPLEEEATRTWHELTQITERLRGTAMAAAERVRAHAAPIPLPSGQDPEELQRKAQRASEEDAALLAEVEDARSALTRANRDTEEAEDQETRCARELTRISEIVADHREKIARLSGDVASAQSRLEAAEAEEARAQSAAAQAAQRAREADALLPGGDMQGSVGGAQGTGGVPEEKGTFTQDTTPAPDSTPAARAQERAFRARDDARKQVDTLLRAERDARAEASKWEARRDALAQMLTPPGDTATVLDHEGITGLLAPLLRAQPGYEDALAALVGDFIDAAIASSLEVGLGEIAGAHAAGEKLHLLIAPGPAPAAGGAVSSAAMPGGAAGDSAAFEAARPALPQGACWLREVVSLEGEATSLEALLEGVVVAPALMAPQLFEESAGVRAVVTREGDVIYPWGLQAGAHTSSLLSIRADCEEAEKEAARARETLTHLGEELARANSSLDQAIREANEAMRALRAEDAERAREAENLARIRAEARAAHAEAQRAQERARTAREHVEWSREQASAAKTRLDQADQLPSTISVDEARARAEEAAARAKQAREAERGALLALRAVEERSRSAQGRARSLRSAHAAALEARATYARAQARQRAEVERARAVEEAAHIAVDAAQAALAQAQKDRDEAAQERVEASMRVREERQRADALSRELEAAVNAYGQGQVAREQARLRAEGIEERALEEFSLTGDELMREYGPDVLVPVVGANEAGGLPFVRADVEEIARQAARDLEKLGRINPLALEEHEALEARHRFLLEQVRDLQSSKADLLQIIEDVDRLVEESFTSAFHETREQFAHVFSVLFPGGQGDLVLSDPQDMLTTGIEIEARPAGKKVKRLSLLSGGERSLAALAFLVAIFKARPSPFYVMDEVEAALDDVNLTRLLEVFRELQETSQLIVITHQKRTMEIADALYGVTMRDGVTAVVSQKLGE